MYILHACTCTCFLQVLCAWDMFEHSLIQSISVKFPFIQRLPDYGPGVLSLLPPSHPHTLTVLCNEYIAELKLGEVGGANQKWSVVSHNHPLCSALYNEHFEQVGVVCILSLFCHSFVIIIFAADST